jgi:hypothetical protein
LAPICGVYFFSSRDGLVVELAGAAGRLYSCIMVGAK